MSASKTGYTSPSDVTRPGSGPGRAFGDLHGTPSTTDTDIASYGATGLPPGLGIDSATGAISGTPDTADANTAGATVTVTDTAGNTATASIAFPAVAKGDQTLTGFAYSPASVTYGDTAPAVTEPGGVRTTLAYSAAPATVCTVDASTGALTLVGVGDCNITATAAPSDDYNQGTATYTVTVTAAGTLDLTLDTIAGDDTVNIAEKAAGFAISGDTGSQGGVSVTVTVGTTELTATSAAAGAWSVDVPANAAYLTGTSVTVTVSASKTGYTAPSDVTRALAVDLTAPSATYAAPSSLQVGVAVGALTPSTTDTDIASYGATGLPPGLGIDSMTGAISGTPDTADANTADATVTVTDTAGNTATASITFPAVAKGDQILTGFAYSPATVTYGDTVPAVTAPGGVQTTLAYSATPSDVCTVDASTGALTLVGVGACNITATAAGAANYNEATAAFTVTVQAAGALALTLDTMAGDDTVNSAEKAAGFAISGATGSEGGVSVTVTVGTTDLTATSATGGAWSVDVPPGASYLTGTSVAVRVSASKTGYTAPSDVTRALAVDLAAPSATYTAPSSLQVGVAVGAMTPSTTDTDIASYGATGLPPGLGIDSATGAINGTPDTGDANTADATVTVTDTAGNTATVDITFPAVAKGNQTLTGFAYSPATVTYGDTAPAVTAPGGVQTTLSYSATPATVCTVDASTGALTPVGVGECVITATAAGAANYNEATAAFTVTVQAAGALALTLDAIAGDNTVNIAEKAAGFAISGATGSEGGVSVTVTVGSTPLTATSAAAGAWSVDVPPGASYLTGTSVAVTVSASKTGYTAPGDVTRALAVDLTAPSATYAAPSSLQVGVAVVAMTPSTTDTDIASYGATGLPPGLGIDSMTGAISGTPDTADANTAEATVTVTDTAGNTATASITFPAVAKGDQTLTGFAYSPASVTFGGAVPAVTAPGGVQTTLSYSATPATVCTVDASTGALTLVGVGECNITATAAPSDDYNQGTATYTVTVAAAGTLVLTLDTIAGDDTVNIAEKAAGFAISGDTGSEGGVSVTVTVGTTELTATSDSGGAWSVDVPANAAYLTGTSVAVTVSASKTGYTPPSDVTRALAVDLAAPSATYTAPSSLQVGVAVGALTPSTTDTDIASYGATGLPPGLGIDSTTGAISGTPDTADANTADATVTVTDTAGNTDTVDIAFPAVAKGDQTLTGFAYSPASVTYGDTVPAVTAPGGVQTTLAYSATPATVCTVDASTGALTLAGVGECNITATAASSDDYNQGTATYTVTVADDPEGFDIAVSAPAALDEDAGAGVVTVTLTTRQNSRPVSSVDMYYAWDPDETATRGDDYTPPPGRAGSGQSVIFATVPPSAFSANAAGTAWVAERSFSIGIVDDGEGEPDETIVFHVRTNISVYRSATQTIVIRDDDTYVTSVVVASAPQSGDTYRLYETILFTVTFSEPVEVTHGRLRLEVGLDNPGGASGSTVEAVFSGLSQSQRPTADTPQTRVARHMHFEYKVQLFDRDEDGVRIGPNALRLASGARIRNGEVGGDAMLDHAAVGPLSDHKVDGSADVPVIDGIEVVSTPRLRSRGARKPDLYGEGENIRIEVRFDQPVHVEGEPTLALEVGDPCGSVCEARYESGSGTDTLVFAYLVLDGDIDRNGIEIPADPIEVVYGDSIRNAAGQEAHLSFDRKGMQSGHKVDGSRAAGPQLWVEDAEAHEADGEMEFTVRLEPRGLGLVTVDYATRDGSGSKRAVAGEDYTETRGTLRFNPLGRERTVTVPIIDDDEKDDGETFTLTLSNPRHAELRSGDAEATGTIRNSDPEAALSAAFPASAFASASHTGADDRPQVVVAFSEPVAAFGADTPSVSVTGGRVASVQPHAEDGLENAWVFFLVPDGGGDVTFALVADAACASGGICTAGGQALTEVPAASTIPGPGGPAEPAGPRLTASFEGVPERHDGSAFRFGVAFSEDIGISFRALREDAFTVTGGRVTGGKRVDGRRDLFRMTVRPDSDADVTITLPAGRECGVSGAICTKGENRRQLTNTPSATVAGPADDGPEPNTPATGAPEIAGTPRVGEELTASTSDISDADGLADASFAYQWLRGGADISGATGADYTAAEADEGERLKVRVDFSDDAGNRESLTSAATDAVEAAPRANAPAQGRPEIRGTARVGETLTASTSGISDADGLDNAAFAYRWLRGGADIPGATGSSYTAENADEGERLKVRVDFTDDAGNDESLTSAATDAVEAAPRANAPAQGRPEIRGTARVGETLTASTSGISDADGLDNAAFAYRWLRGGADIPGATGSSYTAENADEGERLKVRVDFTDDAGNDESLTSAATDAVEAAPRANAPAQGRPEIRGTARVGETLTASTSGISDADGLDNAAFAYRWLRGGADIPGATGASYTAVEADEGERLKVRVDFADDAGNDESLASGSTRRVGARPLPKVSVADARVREAAGATLDFAVTLSAPPPGPVTVDYRTVDASAKAGEDYEARAGTLAFAAGETAKTLRVTVLDDAMDEGEEKMVVVLDPGPGVARGDRLATGTIENHDPMPRALLARFGRTAAVHVVEHVEERLEAPRAPGFRGRFAGRELRRGMERDMALGFLRQLQGMAGAGSRGTDSMGAGSMGVASPMGAAPAAGAATLRMSGPVGGGGRPVASAPLGGAAAMGRTGGALSMGAGPMGAAAGALGGAAATGGGSGPDEGFDRGRLLRMGLGGGDMLTGSDFALNRETRGGILSIWSRGAQSRFSGREGALSLGGDVRTTMFGADYARGPLVAGLSLSNSRGLGEYTGASGGQVASSVTGLYPWLGYQATDRVKVWGVAGYGTGGMLLTPQSGQALESGLSMAMAAAGTRGELLAGGSSGFALAFKADALWVGTAIDGVDGPAGRLKATDAAVTRFRTGLEGSRAYTLAGRLSLRPSVEVGLRHDGGDAETGAGMDVGVGLVVSDAGSGLAVDVRVRTLLVHQDKDFSERGVAVSLSYNPTPSSPLGFLARVAPSWGGQATSGAEALWGRETMVGMARGGVAQGNSLDAEVGYGLPVGSRFVGTPKFGLRTSAHGKDYRLGYSLGALSRERLALDVGVEAQRRENAMQGGASNGVLGQASLGW